MIISYHFGASSEEYCDGLRVLALLDDEHPVFGRSERHLSNYPRGAQLVGGELLEAGNDSTAGGDCDELNLGTAHPPRVRKTIVLAGYMATSRYIVCKGSLSVQRFNHFIVRGLTDCFGKFITQANFRYWTLSHSFYRVSHG